MLFRLCFMVFLMGMIPLSFSEIYKWVDKEGRLHYGDKKIEGASQETVSVESAKSDWSRFDIEIKGVDINLTKEEYKEIFDSVNNIYEFYDRVLYFDIYKTVPVNILILKDKMAYFDYLRQKKLSGLASTYGVYFRKENQIIVYLRKNRQGEEDRRGTLRTIKHEASHAVVDTIMPYVPAWLNEGLAEQMETLKRSDAGLYIESHPINRRNVAYAEKAGKLINISAFLKLPSTKWRHNLANSQKTLQNQAGQFVYFLLSTPPNRKFVTRLMHKFGRGDRTLSYYLVDDNYIGGVKTMEVEWANWVKNQSSKEIRFY